METAGQFYPSGEELTETRELVHKKITTEIKTNFPDIQLPDSMQENDLRIYYELEMINICSTFEFPNDVLLASVILHKRYYLKNSLLLENRDPYHIMLCCIFLGCKLSNIRIDIHYFKKNLPAMNPKLVLDFEFIILTDIGFDIGIAPIFSSLEGFLLFANNFGIESDSLRGFIKEKWFSFLICSDVLLMYPQSYIALTIVLEGIRECKPDSYELYLERIQSSTISFRLELIYAIVKYFNEFNLAVRGDAIGDILRERESIMKQVYAVSQAD